MILEGPFQLKILCGFLILCVNVCVCVFCIPGCKKIFIAHSIYKAIMFRTFLNLFYILNGLKNLVSSLLSTVHMKTLAFYDKLLIDPREHLNSSVCFSTLF